MVSSCSPRRQKFRSWTPKRPHPEMRNLSVFMSAEPRLPASLLVFGCQVGMCVGGNGCWGPDMYATPITSLWQRSESPEPPRAPTPPPPSYPHPLLSTATAPPANYTASAAFHLRWLLQLSRPAGFWWWLRAPLGAARFCWFLNHPCKKKSL